MIRCRGAWAGTSCWLRSHRTFSLLTVGDGIHEPSASRARDQAPCIKCSNTLPPVRLAASGSAYDGSLVVLSSTAVEGVDSTPLGPLPAQLSWFIDRLRGGEILKVQNHDQDLAPEAVGEAEYFARTRLHSHLTIPFRIGGNIIGVIAFAAFRETRAWPDDLIARLTLVGAVLFIDIISRPFTPMSFAVVGRHTAFRGAMYAGAAVGVAAMGAAAYAAPYAYAPPPVYARPACGYYPYPPCYSQDDRDGHPTDRYQSVCCGLRCEKSTSPAAEARDAPFSPYRSAFDYCEPF